MSDSAQSWARDKRRFVADADEASRLGVAPKRDHGYPTGPLGRQFADLTTALLNAQTVADVLEQVVDAIMSVAPDVDVVSVTLRNPDGTFHTPLATHSVGRMLDQCQYDMDEGPCVTAAMNPGPAFAAWPEPDVPSPWPRFTRAARKLGVEAILSLSLLPMPQPPRLSGALNLYSHSPAGLDAVDRGAILLLATHASLALANTEAVTTAKLREAQLRQAIDSRDVIGQAKGILMGRRNISADEAFDILRKSSMELNMKLAQVAKIVASHPDILG
ncbi:GAF and ANTAR domain-containing protein [Mycobacterium sp. GA-2829]|uniref:GAF and ANTAR domain-containing protein n=1 Tax=Mycobacterium sp. GA-2829 TaxID=1772283 RepID=UPI0009EB345B|nr:GAF and ANTAR domain-containing protein [Mycobacterium sp. GA-2829]